MDAGSLTVFNELRSLLDLVHEDGTIHDLDQQYAQTTYGAVLLELMQRLEQAENRLRDFQ